MAASKNNKKCFVLKCKNCSNDTPDKLFFNVPRGVKTRKQWFEAVKRKDEVLPKSTLYCCEDHFDLADDTHEYMQPKPMAGNVKLKPGVVPHLSIPHDIPKRHLRLEEYLRDKNFPAPKKLPRCVSQSRTVSPSSELKDVNSSRGSIGNVSSSENNESPHKVTHMEARVPDSVITSVLSHADAATQTDMEELPIQYDAATQNDIAQVQTWKRKGQTVPKYFSSVHSMPTTSAFNVKKQVDTGDYEEDYVIGNCDEKETQESMSSALASLKVAFCLITLNPLSFVGISKDRFADIIELLSTRIESNSPILNSKDIVCIILWKLKLHDSFERMSDHFGISGRTVEGIFITFLPNIASTCSEFVVWMEPEENSQPVSFQGIYASAKSIIYMVEIEIEEPSDPEQRAQTWSVKNENTVKYVVSMTPEGLTTFVSTGFGGRTSDFDLLLSCGYLDHLKPGMFVVACEGFQGAEKLLQAKGCNLMRLPSVNGSELSSNEITEARKFASLRRYVESLIGRVRQFAFLSPHARVPVKLVPLLDDALKFCAALVNMQLSTTKK